MDEITQQNAALVEETTAAARSLKNQADGLMSQVSCFQLPGRSPTRQALTSAPPKPRASNGRESVRTPPQAARPTSRTTVPNRAPPRPTPSQVEKWAAMAEEERTAKGTAKPVVSPIAARSRAAAEDADWEEF